MGPRTFAFTLAVAGIPPEGSTIIDQLRARGLADTVIEQRGVHTFISFVRDAKAPDHALDRAIAEIELGVVTTKVVKIVDELLTIEEVGRRANMRGEMITSLADLFADSFPAPEGFTQSGARLWRWSQMRLWLATVGHYPEGEVGEPLPPGLIYARNQAFEEDARGSGDPATRLPERAAALPAESEEEIAVMDAIDEIFADLEQDPFGDE